MSILQYDGQQAWFFQKYFPLFVMDPLYAGMKPLEVVTDPYDSSAT